MPRFLLTAPIYAASMLTGGGQRTFHIFKSLSRFGMVDVMLVSEKACVDLEAGLDDIKQGFAGAGEVFIHRSTEQFIVAPPGDSGLGVKLSYMAQRVVFALKPRSHFYRPSEPAKVSLATRMSQNNYSAIVGRYLQSTALSGALDQKQVPVMVDLDDLDEKVIWSRIQLASTSRLRRGVLTFHALQTGRLAKRLRRKCSYLFVASKADREFVGLAKSSVIPNIPLRKEEEASLGAPSIAREAIVLFVGSHGHRANREGVVHFVRNCWPSIHAKVPGARFRIVGSGNWDWLRGELESTAGVEVVGMVENLVPEYRSAAFSVVPVNEGSGTKIKVLESLMYGRAVVASAHSAHGYEDLVGNGLSSAPDDTHMVQLCITMLNDPTVRDQHAEKGRRLVDQNYSSDAVFRSLQEALTKSGIVVSA